MITIRPPSTYQGNLGDEAIVLGILDSIPQQFGLVLEKPPTGPLKNTREPDPNDEIWMCGGDVIDGTYDDGEYLKGLNPTRILGFSWNRPHPNVIPQLQALNTKFYIRDEYSLERFTKDTGLPAFLTSDLAFLSKKQEIPRYLGRDSIYEFLDNSNYKILINVSNFKHAKLNWHHLAKCLNEIVNIKILLIYHDLREGSGDVEATYCFSKLLKCPFMVCEHLNSRMVKSLCEKVDAVITGRLHLAIFALSVGTPVFGVDYNNKMPGIFKQFDCEENTNRDLSEIQAFLGKLADYRSRILANLPKVVERAKLNII